MDFRHGIMFYVQRVYEAACQHDGRSQDGIVDIGSVAGIPFSINFSGLVDDFLIHRCGLKLRAKKIGDSCDWASL